MSSEACPMEHLVEAKHDGRLGARENASLDRHLAACAPCRALGRTLDDVRARLRAPTGDRVTPLEHQRGRLALLRAAAAPPPAQAASLGARYAGFAAAACLALAATSLLGARVVAPPPPPSLARRLPAVSFRWPERTETTIQGSSDARYERRADGPMERVELAEGKLALAVRKLAVGERFVVATADAEVEVRGTVFEVEAHDGKLSSVAVTEGKVEVRHHGAQALVVQGGSWRPVVVPDPVVTTPSVAAPSVAAPSVAAPSVAAPSVAPPHRPVASAAAPAPVAPEDVASKKFAAAVAKLASGDYGEASRQLAEFRKANPADARAEDAAFLAIVSLQRAGKLTDAREAARRYLSAYPGGDRRAEAEKAAR